MSFIATASSAEGLSTIHRYLTVKNTPTTAQINPLNTVQTIHFPTSIQTIGDAVNYWLRHSGYHLANKEKLPNSLLMLFKQPIPQVHKNLGPLTIAQGLKVLVGPKHFLLRKNDITREVRFSLIQPTLTRKKP